MRRWLIALILMLIGIMVLWWLAPLAGHYAGEGRGLVVPLEPGSPGVPSARGEQPERDDKLQPALQVRVVTEWAKKELPEYTRSVAKHAPRVALAKLAARRDVEQVNTYLKTATPWGTSGSVWECNPNGDYDFTEVTLITALYLYGDDPEVLEPETIEHILNVLLIDEGGEPRPMVPRSLGLVLDTENHHLMTEGSRYLKNQWLFQHGRRETRYDNAANGLETWLLDYLNDLHQAGLYEFNSIPYLGYTVQALLNLEAFPKSEEIREAARAILDEMNWQYALGSLDLRRCAPFRRRYDRAVETSLVADRHTALMEYWIFSYSGPPQDRKLFEAGTNQVLLASLLPYRLPDTTRAWVLEKPAPYFARIGRGPGASPEIYSGGPTYLLSAGGVNRGKRSLIIARPTTLMLRDGMNDYRDCFHIRGKGDFYDWHNTGVHRRFACGNGPVAVPTGETTPAQAAGWDVYARSDPKLPKVAVFTKDDLGILVVFPDWKDSPQALADALHEANRDEDALRHRFVCPEEGRPEEVNTLTYDVNAPKGTWVIESVNDEPVDRDYDKWPRIVLEDIHSF